MSVTRVETRRCQATGQLDWIQPVQPHPGALVVRVRQVVRVQEDLELRARVLYRVQKVPPRAEMRHRGVGGLDATFHGTLLLCVKTRSTAM
jgi:hypothetical protein